MLEKTNPPKGKKAWSLERLGIHYGRNKSAISRYMKKQREARELASKEKSNTKIHENKTHPLSKVPILSKKKPKTLISLRIPEECQTDAQKETYTDFVIEWMYQYCSLIFKWSPLPAYIREIIHTMLFQTDTRQNKGFTSPKELWLSIVSGMDARRTRPMWGLK